MKYLRTIWTTEERVTAAEDLESVRPLLIKLVERGALSRTIIRLREADVVFKVEG